MADVATAIRAHLMAQSAVTALISTRLYPGNLPPNATLPAVTMQLADGEHFRHLKGESGVANAVIRFDAYNLDPLDSRKDAGIVEKIRLALLDPDLPHTTVQGLWIEDVELISGPIELPSDPRDASQRTRFRTICNYRVSFAEAVPT